MSVRRMFFRGQGKLSFIGLIEGILSTSDRIANNNNNCDNSMLKSVTGSQRMPFWTDF